MKARTPEQIKHLELLQANIARMHDAARSMKQFAVVGFALGGSMARYLKEPTVILFTAALVIAFWLLDARYLQFERSFRMLYDQTRCEAAGERASFELTPPKVRFMGFRTLVSWTTSLLYVSLLALLVIAYSLADW